MTGEQRRHSLADRRTQLLDAAVSVMAEGGVASATTRAITQRAGVPHGVFHYSFDSKTHLIRALLERESEEAMSRTWEVGSRSGDARAVIAEAIRSLLGRVRDNPDRFIVLSELTALARTDPALSDFPALEHERSVAVVAALLERWISVADEARAVAVVILATVTGMIDGYLSTRSETDLESSVNLFADLISTSPTLQGH